MKTSAANRSAHLTCMMLVLAATTAPAQQPATSAPAPAQPTQTNASAAAPNTAPTAAAPSKPPKEPNGSERGRAIKFYLSGSKQFEKEQFEPALHDFQRAADLDPANTAYQTAVEVARSHAVTALIQQAARAHTRGDAAGAQQALARAAALDPQNSLVVEHVRELGDDVAETQTQAVYEQGSVTLGSPEPLAPTTVLHSFHVRNSERTIIQQVFRAYGIEPTVDESVRTAMVKFDLDDAPFALAARVLGISTESFYVPIDPHRVLVARDTRENRQQFMRTEVETVYLSGLTATEMTDMGNVAKNVFEVQQAAVDATAGTLTLHGTETTLNAFNSTYSKLMDGRSQVLLDVRLIQLAHNNARNTGVQLPQSMSAFNVDAEAASILNANQSLVQQIIASGLAAPGDTLAILGILLASGQVSSSLFSSGGIATFGGGIAQTAVVPGTASLNLNLNSSDSRELDDFQLRLEDGEEGTLKSGERYPIMTSNYSSLGSSSLNIPGLNTAGNSGSLASILSSLQGAASSVPQVQYQDIGLTLKATPRVLRSGEVALNMDMKISALAGTSVNGVPVLNSRAYSGVVTLRQNEGVVIISEVDSQESRAISGIPGLSEIPGLNNVTDKDTQKNTSSLLIIVTPRVLHSPSHAGHSPMLRIDRSLQSR